jgi:hypothetical protein
MTRLGRENKKCRPNPTQYAYCSLMRVRSSSKAYAELLCAEAVQRMLEDTLRRAAGQRLMDVVDLLRAMGMRLLRVLRILHERRDIEAAWAMH